MPASTPSSTPPAASPPAASPPAVSPSTPCRPAASRTDPARAFRAATAIRVVGEDEFTAEIDAGWGYRGKANGGYLMAVSARAALAAVDGTAPPSDGGTAPPSDGGTAAGVLPLAVTTSFLRAPAAGPITLRTVVPKSGRQATHVRVAAYQDGVAVLESSIVCGTLPDAEPTFLAASDTSITPYDRCVPVVPHPDHDGLADRVAVRYDPALAPTPTFGTVERGRLRGWADLVDGGDDDPLRILLVADVLAPTITTLGIGGWAPTVQMSTYLRAVPAPGPLAVTVSAGAVVGDWFDESAEVHDRTGRLVAQSRQTALIARPRA